MLQQNVSSRLDTVQGDVKAQGDQLLSQGGRLDAKVAAITHLIQWSTDAIIATVQEMPSSNAIMMEESLKEIAQQLKDEAASSRENDLRCIMDRFDASMSSVRDQISSIDRKVSEMQAMLKDVQLATRGHTKLLRSLAQDESDCPRFVIFAPKPNPKTFFGKAMKMTDSIFSKPVIMYTVCPVCMCLANQAHADTFEERLPNEWVHKYGPALKMSITILKVGLSVCKSAGYPVPIRHARSCRSHRLSDLDRATCRGVQSAQCLCQLVSGCPRWLHD